MLVNRPHAAPLLLVGDLTFEVSLLAAGRIPGIGPHAQLRKSSERVLALQRHRPGLVILAAHDPAAAAMLAEAQEVAV